MRFSQYYRSEGRRAMILVNTLYITLPFDEYGDQSAKSYEMDDNDEHFSFLKEIKEMPISDNFVYTLW